MDGRDAGMPPAGPETGLGATYSHPCGSLDPAGPQIGAENVNDYSTVKRLDGREICYWCPFVGCSECRWAGGEG